MKRLVLASDNFQNYIIVEDTEKEVSWVQDYDLSEEEIEKVREQFLKGELDTEDVEILEGDDTALDSYRNFGFEILETK